MSIFSISPTCRGACAALARAPLFARTHAHSKRGAPGIVAPRRRRSHLSARIAGGACQRAFPLRALRLAARLSLPSLPPLSPPLDPASPMRGAPLLAPAPSLQREPDHPQAPRARARRRMPQPARAGGDTPRRLAAALEPTPRRISTATLRLYVRAPRPPCAGRTSPSISARTATVRRPTAPGARLLFRTILALPAPSRTSSPIPTLPSPIRPIAAPAAIGATSAASGSRRSSPSARPGSRAAPARRPSCRGAMAPRGLAGYNRGEHGSSRRL